jgi:hypothetical protein
MSVAAIAGSGLLKLVLGSMIWAELVGVPVAWLRLRNTAEWSNRSRGMRRLDLLARYVGKVTGMVGIWALVIVIGAALTSLVS